MIHLDDVRFTYDPQETKEVLRGITLDISRGAHVAILGRNGSGKSTCARLLNGLHTATSGQVRVAGLDPANPVDVIEVRRRVQMVFQNPENQQVGTTVFEDIAFGLANIGYPTEHMPARAAEALALVGLDLPFDRSTSNLSGGEMQRLALASALALRPEVLVLDEVTSMLDPESATRFAACLAELRAGSDLTVIQITHHLEEVEDADRVVVIDGGRIVADGPPQSVFAQTALLRECGLRPPYAWRPSADPEPRRRRVEGAPLGTPAVETIDVAVGYSRPGRRRARSRRPADRTVLSHVDLRVSPGELVAITGRSGSGKSTLVAAVKGLLRPWDGHVEVHGIDPWATRRPGAFDVIGYVFQRPEHQLFATMVRDDVAFGLRSASLTDEERSRRVDGALHRLGLLPHEIGPSSPFELSGGQQRRVALAGVLVTEPAVLILDEPTAGLDHPSREALFDILDSLRRAGTAILWISHRFDEVLENADRLVVIDGGTAVADGDPEEVLARGDLQERMGWAPLPQLDADRRRGSALLGVVEGEK